MTRLKSLSIIMAALLAVQAGINPAVFAMNPNNTAKERSKQEKSNGDEMKRRIQDYLLKIKVFRPDLENTIDTALKGLDKDKDDLGIVSVEEKSIEQIIEEDNLEELQRAVEMENDNMNIIIEDSFFEMQHMRIPILHYCAMKKAIKCFKFLILNGADPSKKLENEDDSNKYEWDCMSVAICFGEWEMMKILEERCIEKINNPNVWEAAALTHRNKMLKLLISKEAEIQNFQECLNKALLGAAKGNNLKGLKLLLERGAKVNAMDEDGWTPLHFAAENDADKVAELLISKGAEVNARSKDGWTPLHSASMYDFVKVGELLIDAGADVNAATDYREGLPLDIAMRKKSYKMENLLISKGAKVSDEYLLLLLEQRKYQRQKEEINAARVKQLKAEIEKEIRAQVEEKLRAQIEAEVKAQMEEQLKAERSKSDRLEERLKEMEKELEYQEEFILNMTYDLNQCQC